MELEAVKDLPEKKTMQVEILPNGDAVLPVMDDKGNFLKYWLDSGAELDPMVKNFAPYIQGTPATPESLYNRACANDKITINSWRDQWISQTNVNKAKYDFIANSVLQVAGSEALRPVIIAGSGPSLRKNVQYLKPTYQKRIYPPPVGPKWEMHGGKQGIKVISCLHNFAFMEDMDVMTKDDFYITLDAGDITIREVFEGGRHGEDWYWERTKDRTLCAYTATHPMLLEKWRGKILFYSTPPNPATIDALKSVIDLTKIPPFNVGGNVLGAALYMARAILGCGPVITIGADLCFSRDRHFHGWNSSYDAQFRGVEAATDIYGDRVYTWPSYYNFKCWFDYMAMGGASNMPHLWINCTEGGILGAYPEGNIQQIKQMTLRDCLASLNMYLDLPKAMSTSIEIPRLLF